MKVYLVQGKRNLQKLFQENHALWTGTQCMLLDGNQACRGLLAKHGVLEIARQQRLDEKSREEFLKEYINLVGMIGQECNSRAWWATDIASKNRETSRLTFLLCDFLSIVETISKADGNDLLIVNPSWVLMDSLQAYLSQKKLAFLSFPEIFSKRKEIISARFRTMVRVLYALVKLSIRKIYFTFRLRKRIKELTREKKYYIVKTFIYDHSFLSDGSYRDAFYGSLPDFLKQKENVIVLATILGRCRACIEKIKRCQSCLIIPLEVFLSFKDAVPTAIETVFTSVRIKNKIFFFGFDVTGIVNGELKRTCNGIDFYQSLYYDMIRRLVESVKVKTFLLTYENNPWEKMSMLAIRGFSPETEIIGYQHTVVPQASANAFISSKESNVIPMPDRILTVGKIPKEIMEKYGSYDSGKIEPACGLRFEYLFNSSKCERKRRGHILLAVEGLNGAHRLVNYVIKELSGNMKYEVRVRTHPALPLALFKSKLTHPLDGIPNFSLSQNISLQDDLEWSDIVIYWGSTVSLEALVMGKPVIRYDTDSGLSYDPLFQCGHLKWIVYDDTPITETIHDIFTLDDDRFNQALEKARQYIKDYFFPVTSANLELFLPRERRRMVNDVS